MYTVSRFSEILEVFWVHYNECSLYRMMLNLETNSKNLKKNTKS